MPPRPKANHFTGLTLIGPTTWSAVYRQWKREEGSRADWNRHLRGRGFSSWPKWRSAVLITPFHLKQKKWKKYRVTDPRVVADWHGGPFPGWKKNYYHRAMTRSFRWLVAEGKIKKNWKVVKIKNIPKKIFLFGLVYRGHIIILDGMHRCGAIAVHLAQKKSIRTNITIALADTPTLPKLKPRSI